MEIVSRRVLRIILAVFCIVMGTMLVIRYSYQKGKARFAQLHLGMPKDSVIHVMGTPKRIRPGFIDDQFEMYDYGGVPLGADNYNVYFNDSDFVVRLVQP